MNKSRKGAVDFMTRKCLIPEETRHTVVEGLPRKSHLVYYNTLYLHIAEA